MAKVLAERGYDVQIWCFEEAVATEINEKGTNQSYLPAVDLPPTIRASSDLVQVGSSKDYLLLAVPSPFLLATVKELLPLEEIREGEGLIGVLTKGFITSSRGTKLILEALEDYLPGSYKGNLVYISGPSHAEEVADGKITGLISASLNGKNSIKFRKLLSGGNLMVYCSFDIVGVQVCAALKNVIAIAFGILDAMKETSEYFGDNTESLLLAAGLNEIQKLGQTLGASHPETFTSIAGVGDLDVTCRSRYGRNRRFGRDIILNDVLRDYRDIDDLIEKMPNLGYLPEGVYASKCISELAKNHKLKLPIFTTVYRILNKEADPDKQVTSILKGMGSGVGPADMGSEVGPLGVAPPAAGSPAAGRPAPGTPAEGITDS
jgi:glycerol-3-phosphate dehydrogenase (NAD(P)+)